MARNDWRDVMAPDFSTAMRGLELADRSLAGAFEAANRGLDVRNNSLTEKQRVELQDRMNPAQSGAELEGMIRDGQLFDNLNYLSAADRNVAQTQVDNLLKRESTKKEIEGQDLRNIGQGLQNRQSELNYDKTKFDFSNLMKDDGAARAFNANFGMVRSLLQTDPSAAQRIMATPEYKAAFAAMGPDAQQAFANDQNSYLSSEVNRRAAEDGILTGSLNRRVTLDNHEYTQTQRKELDTVANLLSNVGQSKEDIGRTLASPEFAALSGQSKLALLTQLKDHAAGYGVDLTDQITKWANDNPGGDGTNLASDWTGTAASAPGDWVRGMMTAEGTGQNSRSSANGYGQFTKGTWANTLLQMDRPTFLRLGGKIKADGTADVEGSSNALFAARTDKDLAARAIGHHFVSNERALRNNGVQPTDASRYGAWFLGSGTAARVWNSAADRPIADALGSRSAEIIKANPEVFKNVSTAGQLRARLGNIYTYGHGNRNGRTPAQAGTAATTPRDANMQQAGVESSVASLQSMGLAPADVELFTSLANDPRTAEQVAKAKAADETSPFFGMPVPVVRSRIEGLSREEGYANIRPAQRAMILERSSVTAPRAAQTLRLADRVLNTAEIAPVGRLATSLVRGTRYDPRRYMVGDTDQVVTDRGLSEAASAFGNEERRRTTALAASDISFSTEGLALAQQEVAALEQQLARQLAGGNPQVIAATRGRLAAKRAEVQSIQSRLTGMAQ